MINIFKVCMNSKFDAILQPVVSSTKVEKKKADSEGQESIVTRTEIKAQLDRNKQG